MSSPAQTSTLQLLTIIADEALESVLSEEILELGASGYSLTRIEGHGSSGSRDNAWDGENIKLEVIATQETVQTILNLVAEKYFNRYPMIAYYAPVQVLRADRYK